MRRVLPALAALALACGCGRAPEPAPSAAGPAPASAPAPAFHFVDVAKESGLTMPAWCGRKDKPHLLEGDGSGVALVDYDRDGDLDVYLASGWRLEGDRAVEKPGDRLLRNLGDGTFEDVTSASRIGHDGWGSGVAVGDVDGDGWPDILATCFGPAVLYLNRGDGTFARGGLKLEGWITGACFFDADRDGFPDLYACGYVSQRLDRMLHATATLDWKGHKVMQGPFGLEGAEDRFFHNRGDGTFEETTAAAALTDTGKFFGYTPVAFDMDGDGDLDLYVSNDSNPNYLYRNDGKGRFKEVGLWSGAALDAKGRSQASMGVAVADFDQDGKPDILTTNFAEDFTTLYRNTGRGLFTDESEPRGVGPPTYAPLEWGCAFADLDLDGDLDVAIAMGHLYPQADRPGTGTSYAQANMLLENEGGNFRDATATAGPGLAVKLSSRALAAGDVDGDGDVDLIVSNVDAAPTYLRNDSPRRGRWLVVDAPDAREVVVRSGGRTLHRDGVYGGSFKTATDPRFHFGLGAASADTVTVKWLYGGETVLHDVGADRVVRVLRSWTP